jgi:hypothetical protein
MIIFLSTIVIERVPVARETRTRSTPRTHRGGAFARATARDVALDLDIARRVVASSSRGRRRT